MSLALVLTAVAYKLTVAESIPQVAYLILLDWFIGLYFVHITLAAVENSIVPSLDHPSLSRRHTGHRLGSAVVRHVAMVCSRSLPPLEEAKRGTTELCTERQDGREVRLRHWRKLLLEI